MRIDRRACAGQATLEFAVIAAALAAALFMPWADGLSPAEWLLGAVAAAASSVPAWLGAS
jgi:hypothetical protein